MKFSIDHMTGIQQELWSKDTFIMMLILKFCVCLKILRTGQPPLWLCITPLLRSVKVRLHRV